MKLYIARPERWSPEVKRATAIRRLNDTKRSITWLKGALVEAGDAKTLTKTKLWDRLPAAFVGEVAELHNEANSKQEEVDHLNRLLTLAVASRDTIETLLGSKVSLR